MTDGVSREVRLPRPGQSLRGRVEGGRGRHQGRQGGQHRVPGRQHLDQHCTATAELHCEFSAFSFIFTLPMYYGIKRRQDHI